MKTIFLLAMCLGTATLAAQVPTYTNSSPSTVPGNPGLTVPPSNSSNPGGPPNQTDPYPVKPIPAGTNPNQTPAPQPVMPVSPSPANPVNPVNPVNPTSPAGTYPPKINYLFQDPSRTPSYPNSDPIKNANGSTGKYKKKHKTVNGHKFGRSYHKTKTAKPREKSKTTNPEK